MRLAETMADRLLSMVLPGATADAACPPKDRLEDCVGKDGRR